MIRVAYNASCLLHPLTGVGQYTRSLAESLESSQAVDLNYFYASRWSRTLIVAGRGLAPAAPKQLQSPWHEIKSRLGACPRLARTAQQVRFSWRMPTPRPEIYHEPNFLPYRFPGPTVITAHDLSWIRYPQTHPAERVAAMNDLFPAALERAAHVITDAAYVRDEIMAEFGIAPERITSIPLGAREIFHPRPATDCCAVLAARGLAYRGYALCVGTLEPRKNLETALRAHARLDPSLQRDMPLAIVGMKGWRTTSLERALAPRVESGVVRPLGYVDDADLPALYAGALALVYPSIYEGFGLPPLEAMACGTPVIVSNRSSLPEVVGDAGILVEPEDETAIASALERLRDDPAYRAERSQAGLARASMYSWDRTARETLAVYRRVLASAA